jgi:hypothetical protein
LRSESCDDAAAADALRVAQARALGELLKREPPGSWHDALSHALTSSSNP